MKKIIILHLSSFAESKDVIDRYFRTNDVPISRSNLAMQLLVAASTYVVENLKEDILGDDQYDGYYGILEMLNFNSIYVTDEEFATIVNDFERIYNGLFGFADLEELNVVIWSINHSSICIQYKVPVMQQLSLNLEVA